MVHTSELHSTDLGRDVIVRAGVLHPVGKQVLKLTGKEPLRCLFHRCSVSLEVIGVKDVLERGKDIQVLSEIPRLEKNLREVSN